MKKFALSVLASLLFSVSFYGQQDNGNKFHQVWYPSRDDFAKGYLANAGMDIDKDGWGEFLLWDVTTQTYLLYEAYADNQYHIVYKDNSEVLNFFDLDRDGQLELVKIHQDIGTLEQWMTIHEWNGINLDASLAVGFSEATKTTNRIPRVFWCGIAHGHGFDRGLWDFNNFDGDDDWDIFAVDAKLTMWGGQIARWNEGTIINILELTNFGTESPQLMLRYTSGPIGNGMLFYGIWNNYIDIDNDGLLDNIFFSDHTQTLMGIRTAGNDSYDPIVIYTLPETNLIYNIPFYHLPSWPVVANYDNDEYKEIYYVDLEGLFWFIQGMGDFESTLDESNIFYIKRVVKKQNSPGATNMVLGGAWGDQDGDGKPDIYYCSKDIGKLVDIEYQGGFAGDSSSFSYTYTDLFFSNGQPMDATMWHLQTGMRYGFPLLDLDKDHKRELIIGGPDTDNMLDRDVATLYIYESEHEAVTNVCQKINATPKHFHLNQNYPNPFNGRTAIRYEMSRFGKAEFVISNVLGEKVRAFNLSHSSPGRYSVEWDGQDDGGANVPSGIYFYRFESDSFSAVKKMLLVR
jgi:hypothetical protein